MRTQLGTTLIALTAWQTMAPAQTRTTSAEHWVSTWATSQPLTATTTLNTPGRGTQPPPPQQSQPGQPQPPAPQGSSGLQGRGRGGNAIAAATALNDQTIRMVVHTTLGGRRVRVEFSNAFSGTELAIGSAHIAVRARESGIVAETDRALTFAGKPGCTIRPGVLMLSDPVDLEVHPLSDLAVSIYLPKDTGPPTNHWLGLHTAWISKGDTTSQESMPDPSTARAYDWLSSVDVAAAANAFSVVALGDSITDGQGTTMDTNMNWAARLAARLAGSKDTADIAILNAGVAGGQVLRDMAGVSALARFDRDVLSRPGVKWLIVFAGINDIAFHGQANSPDPVTSDEIIAGYRQLIERAHTSGIRVVGATITPQEGNGRFATEHAEAMRAATNQWIRTSGAFDAVTDLDAAVRDPGHPSRLRAEFDSGDHIHLNDAGNQAMANALDPGIFRNRQSGNRR